MSTPHLVVNLRNGGGNRETEPIGTGNNGRKTRNKKEEEKRNKPSPTDVLLVPGNDV